LKAFSENIHQKDKLHCVFYQMLYSHHGSVSTFFLRRATATTRQPEKKEFPFLLHLW